MLVDLEEYFLLCHKLRSSSNLSRAVAEYKLNKMAQTTRLPRLKYRIAKLIESSRQDSTGTS